jgi:CHAT domain-containing protein/tetratricopeptide (TPR) repeat protein
MNASSVRLASYLSSSRNGEELLSRLAAAPILLPHELIEVVNHGELHGLPPDQSQRLREMHGLIFNGLRALVGDHDPAVPSHVYGIFAMVSREQNRLDEARRFYRFAFANAAGGWERASAVGGLALLESKNNNTDEARRKFQQAVEICKSAGITDRSLGYLYNNWGVLEKREKHAEEARQLLEAAFSVARNNKDTDLLIKVTLNLASLALAQENPTEAGQALDQIGFIEQSDSPHKADYENLRRAIAGGSSEQSVFDPSTKSIDELERFLAEHPTHADRNLVMRTIGDRYAELTEGSRLHNARSAIYYLEAAVLELEAAQDEAAHTTIQSLHQSLGALFNETARLEPGRGGGLKAKHHFERALALLPVQPEFQRARNILLHDLANAIAHSARDRGSLGGVNRSLLLESIRVQSELLQSLENPTDRCHTQINIFQSYRELCNPPDKSVMEYRAKCWEYALAAQNELSGANHVSADLRLLVASALARSASDFALPRTELEEVVVKLDHLLNAARLEEIPPNVRSQAFFSSALVFRALGKRGQCYRRFLQGSKASHGGRLSGDLELVETLIDWGEFERAIWFSLRQCNVTTISLIGKQFRRRSWMTAPGQALIAFQRLRRTRQIAIVITNCGASIREVPLTANLAIETVARYFTNRRRAASAQESEDDFEALTTFLGTEVFQPLEDLLTGDGDLALLAWDAMSSLPLHAAKLSDGSRLLERFAVTRYECVSLGADSVTAEATKPKRVYIGTYSAADKRLPFAAIEGQAVSSCYVNQSSVEMHEAVTADGVLRGLEDSDLVHLSCHGEFHPGAPLESKLELSDRSLTLRDVILSIERSPCELIVLSACEVGAHVVSREGVTDFASTLLRAGCAFVVAADWRVDDLSTVLLMERMHSEIARGMGPSLALALAQRAIRNDSGAAIASWIEVWLTSVSSRISFAERQYISGVVERLRSGSSAMPFAAPIYWAHFSVRSRVFPVSRRAKLA